MKTINILILMVIAATVSACGSDFEWFPKVSDTTPPTVTASINNNLIFNNSTTHVSSLNYPVTFSANEPATIYYTTNGSDPTNSPLQVILSSANTWVSGIVISNSPTTLKFIGIDQLLNRSAIQSGTIKSP